MEMFRDPRDKINEEKHRPKKHFVSRRRDEEHRRGIYNILFTYFISNIELIIDNSYAKYMRFSDILYNAEIPNTKVSFEEKEKNKKKGFFS